MLLNNFYNTPHENISELNIYKTTRISSVCLLVPILILMLILPLFSKVPHYYRYKTLVPAHEDDYDKNIKKNQNRESIIVINIFLQLL